MPPKTPREATPRPSVPQLTTPAAPPAMPSQPPAIAAAVPESIALIEVGSIAQGYVVADALVKAAEVQLLRVDPVTPGKLVILFSGSVASLETAHARGVVLAGSDLIDQLMLPGVHPDVPRVLEKPGGPAIDALGVIECSTVAAGILAADAAAKAANAVLVEIHAARGIGGKTTILLTGATGDVETSTAAGAAMAENRNALVRSVVIASAHEDLVHYLDGRWRNGP